MSAGGDKQTPAQYPSPQARHFLVPENDYGITLEHANLQIDALLAGHNLANLLKMGEGMDWMPKPPKFPSADQGMEQGYGQVVASVRCPIGSDASRTVISMS